MTEENMIKLEQRYVYYSEYRESNIINKFIEEKDDHYIIEWWEEGKDRKHTDRWSKGGVKKFLNSGKLKREMTDQEKKIAENYNI